MNIENNNFNVSQTVTQETEKNANKSNNNNLIIIVISILAILIAVGIYLGINLLTKKENSADKKEQKIEEVEDGIIEDNLLQSDFEEGKISVDDYVTQSIYRLFYQSKVNERYINSSIPNSFNFDKYVDQMSDETLELYYNAVNLSNVEFVDDSSKVAVSLSNALNADRGDINSLNKVYLSENGNFMLWYSDEGDIKVSDEKIKYAASLFENAVVKYKEDFGFEYKYYSPINKNSERYQTQVNILKNNNIDESYLENAMQIYFIKSSALGIYTHSLVFEKDNIKTRITNILNNDSLTIANKYITISPANLEGEKIELDDSTYYHELFHHYQHYCIDSDGITARENYNDLSGEATSQWAAAKYAANSNQNQNLNVWNDNYSKFSAKMFTDGYKEHGFTIGYALFSLYENIEQNSSLGRKLIIDSIYQEDPMKYINDNMSIEERNSTMKATALHMLKQDYQNKNYLLTKGTDVTIHQTINKDSQEKQYIPISNAGIYYMEYTPNEKEYIKLSIYPEYYSIDNPWASIYLIGYKNNSYELIEQSEYVEQAIYSLSDYKMYEKVYVVIINNDFYNTHNLDILINEEKVTDTSYENYKVKIDTTVSTYGIETISHIEGVVDELHQKEYLKTTSQIMGINVNIETYVDFANKMVYMNNPYTGKWEKSQSTTSKIDLEFFQSKILSLENVTKESDNKYSIKLDKEDLSKISNDNTLQEYTFTGDIYVTLYTKDEFISKIEYDFSDIIEGIDLMKTTMEFYDYNEAGSVEIPGKLTTLE